MNIIDLATREPVALVAVGSQPRCIVFLPDGKKIYVANGRSGSVWVIDTVQNVRLCDIAVGKLPWGVVIK